MAQYPVPNPMTIAGFDVNNETAKLGLHEVVIDSASRIQDYSAMLYKANTISNQLTFKKKVYAGLPRAQSWANTLGTIPTGNMQFLWDVDATHAWYGLSVEQTLEEQTFDPYGINPKIPTELGKSLGEMKQVLAAAFFNDAFSTAWEDGVYFFSASHPYSTSYSASTQSNLVTGTVSVAMAADAINKLVNARDPMGLPLNLMPKRVFCYPTAMMLWEQVLAQTAEYGTANRNESPFRRYKIEVVPWPWLDSSTKWVMQGTDYETYYSQPVGIKTVTEKTDSEGLRLKGYFSTVFWAERWQGYIGGLGT